MGATCLVTGSRIRTAHGDIAVEDLYAGDEIVTLRDGRESVEAVVWVGHRRLDVAAHPHPEEIVPVRIRAHAIAEGQPARDLLLSQDHCLFLDDKCVPAGRLVNGGSIVFERATRDVTYHHVELAKHGIMLAEGLPTESYLDTGNRDWFANAEGPTRLHPDFAVDPDASAWTTDACAPLASSAEEVEPIWSRLAKRSAELGHVAPAARTTSDADIRLVVDGRTLRPVETGEGVYGFAVPRDARSVSLESRFSIPVDVGAPYLGDIRRLGVRVESITIRSDNGEAVINADDPRLTQGWYAAERLGGETWRWTDGAALLPWTESAAPAVVTVRCATAAAYPLYDELVRLVA